MINALDNRSARSHVNRMCLSLDIPLVEAGTAGYDGQVCLFATHNVQISKSLGNGGTFW